MKKIMFLLLILIYVHPVFGQIPENNLRFSSSPNTDKAIITCLFGFHRGDNVIPNSDKQDIEGFSGSVSTEVPFFKSSMFLVSISYNKISLTPNMPQGDKWRITQTYLTVTGGIRFFIEGD